MLRSWAAFPRCDHQPGLLCTWGRLGRSTTSLSLHGPPSGSALPASVSPLSRPGGLANSPCEEPQLCCHCIGKTASDTKKWMATATLQTPCTKSGGPLCLDHQPMTFNFGSILLRYFSREISWLSPPHQSPSYSKYSNAVVFHYNCILWSLITPGLWTVRRVTLHQHSMVGEWGQCPGQPWPGWQWAEAAPGGVSWCQRCLCPHPPTRPCSHHFLPQFCLHFFPNTLIEHLLFYPNTDLAINSQPLPWESNPSNATSICSARPLRPQRIRSPSALPSQATCHSLGSTLSSHLLVLQTL